MMRHAKHLMYLTVLMTCLTGEAVVFSQTLPPEIAQSVEPSELAGSALLDGMTFLGQLGPRGKAADVKDTLVFANGTFVSTECDRRCGYPPAPYFIRRVGDRIEFVSESNCLNKDATLEWRGSVENGKLTGRLHWTSRRWYWTVEREFWFEGTIVDATSPIAGNR